MGGTVSFFSNGLEMIGNDARGTSLVLLSSSSSWSSSLGRGGRQGHVVNPIPGPEGIVGSIFFIKIITSGIFEVT